MFNRNDKTKFTGMEFLEKKIKTKNYPKNENFVISGDQLSDSGLFINNFRF